MEKSSSAGMSRTFLDRVVGYFSPSAGLNRLHARARINVVMNFDAASRGRRVFGWRSPGSSADAAAQSGGAREQLRNLARDFVRNRPYAVRGVSVITSNVVGTGIFPSVNHGDEARKDEIERIIQRHLMTPALDAAGILSLPAQQRVVQNAVVEDGEILVRRRWRTGPFSADLELPFQVELLEADYLNPWVTSHGENEVVDGIEFGPTGRVEAYHLFRRHPGAISYKVELDSVRVPAVDIIHVRRIDRPGQVRGVSWFAPVMMTLGDLSDFQEGELVKQKIAALMAGFIESEDLGGEIRGLNPEDAADDIGLGEVGPGTLTELPPGKKITFTNPPQTNGNSGFVRSNLTAVAMGLGITYESLSGDLNKVNFSSGRMGRLEMDKNIEAIQEFILIDQFCRGIERWTLEAWTLRPRLGPADFSLNWTAPRRALIDPTKEVPALIKEIDAGITSRQRVQRQLGRDPAVVRREINEDAIHDKAAEIITQE